MYKRQDYTSVNSAATISAYCTFAWISVDTLEENIYEANDEYFLVNLTSVSGTSVYLPPSTHASAFIHDSPPTVAISNAWPVNEGISASFQLTLSKQSTADVTVYYNTSNGTASAGTNYTSVNSSTVIPAMSLTAWIPVGTLDDGVYEANDECPARRNFQLGNEIKKWSNCLSNSG